MFEYSISLENIKSTWHHVNSKLANVKLYQTKVKSLLNHSLTEYRQNCHESEGWSRIKEQ